jgi:hypothetical protein
MRGELLVGAGDVLPKAKAGKIRAPADSEGEKATGEESSALRIFAVTLGPSLQMILPRRSQSPE